MKIEKINENKIRITLNIDDLKRNNIDIHSFMSNPIETQSVFLNMLDIAEEKFGFVTRDYRLSIEALAMPNNIFILTVTRTVPENEKNKKKVILKRKSNSINKGIAIYSFDNFEDFIALCESINKNHLKLINTYIKNISLYILNSKYYLLFDNISNNIKSLKIISSFMSEFGQYIHDSDLYMNKILEYGKVIIPKNAIKSGIKYFVK